MLAAIPVEIWFCYLYIKKAMFVGETVLCFICGSAKILVGLEMGFYIFES